MDFDMIEGMSNEEIENMYDIYNNDILDNDGARSAWCECYSSSGVVEFGYIYRGGCFLQLTYSGLCYKHCIAKGFGWSWFYADCICLTTGRASTWSACAR